MTEDMLDLDQFFQELKLTQYTWERYYFELDMIPINLAPWYWYADAGKVPGFSERVWNNPCRYIHQHNNGWLYPYYGEGIPKYEGDDFDMGKLFKERGKDGYGFVVHETFHGAQGELMDTLGVDEAQAQALIQFASGENPILGTLLAVELAEAVGGTSASSSSRSGRSGRSRSRTMASDNTTWSSASSHARWSRGAGTR